MLQAITLVLIVAIILYIPIINNLKPQPNLTAVKKSERDLLKPNERYLYDFITSQGYYVSCSVNSGLVKLSMALIPFRTAIITNKTSQFNFVIMKWYLKLQGWKVYYLKGDNTDLHELKELKHFLEKQCRDYNNEDYGNVQ
ncbi:MULTISPECIES: hypothetical protein [Bacillaceae]|uniref:DUF2726 domain-containing protein n=1 Tax=Evansella alkalicola TaxID=745819 RepID=A0ABS6JTS6_9BACI|nr:MULTISPECIES: hypothetical protein [Bacillaceae]MBU9721956.1 hypothetical protein [Bacillus alkalicola]